MAATDLAKVGKQGAKALVRNGKVAIKGVRKGFAKGTKTFDDLGQRLSKKLRFNVFNIRQISPNNYIFLNQSNSFLHTCLNQSYEIHSSPHHHTLHMEQSPRSNF
ncbi:hypothetical protein GCM10009122_40460 [Fulvivirga kasyanovii]|uniref:hypothetical protein n=1 Tax=Fulvivirga kasyanovii TaxID=396812 RepID=UPI0031CF1930